MSRYSVSERIFIVRTYYSNNNSPIVTQRKFATEFKLKTTGPSVSTINRLIQKLERTGSERILALGYPKSKNICIDWPPYSPDLNPCDSFLWGYIKDKVYAGNPRASKT
ncbi:hypothetical protein AVEN_181010-1 [Araneus ventricosus]|uniref:DUF4817 domain-containing protein n=1 Tax=Araneus ventricosus TaxID=182803 RepID=A0A4Y2KAP4_ARAVE|nr:hypothetical protein AVEN_181010-1 [Araneus ventricosus]